VDQGGLSEAGPFDLPCVLAVAEENKWQVSVVLRLGTSGLGLFAVKQSQSGIGVADVVLAPRRKECSQMARSPVSAISKQHRPLTLESTLASG
jgi:hypothetical protein